MSARLPMLLLLRRSADSARFLYLAPVSSLRQRSVSWKLPELELEAAGDQGLTGLVPGAGVGPDRAW